MALGTAIVIAFYTVIDGIGVRWSGAPAAYTMWIFLLTGLTTGGWGMVLRGKPLLQSLRTHPWVPLLGGGCTLLSYGIALWAMTRAPVAAVAALRETSILFAVLISVFALKEAATWYRIVAVVLLMAGAVAIRLSEDRLPRRRKISPAGLLRRGFFELCWRVLIYFSSALGRPGSVLLSRGLSRSTMDAEGFDGRVRNGIG